MLTVDLTLEEVEQCRIGLRFNDDLNIAKIRRFVWKRGSFALQKPFLLSITTKRSCWHITIGDRKRGTILGRMEISRPLHRKAKILWQLENLQNYKDLYGKPLERDWRAKRLLLIQILLISNAHKNSPLKDMNLKICM